jgi:hypothetical protein
MNGDKLIAASCRLSAETAASVAALKDLVEEVRYLVMVSQRARQERQAQVSWSWPSALP